MAKTIWAIVGFVVGIGGTIVLSVVGTHTIRLNILAGSCRVDSTNHLYIGVRFENSPTSTETPYGLSTEVIEVDTTVIDSIITRVAAFHGPLQPGRSDSLTYEFALINAFERDSTALTSPFFEGDSTTVVLRFEWYEFSYITRTGYRQKTLDYPLTCRFSDSSAVIASRE